MKFDERHYLMGIILLLCIVCLFAGYKCQEAIDRYNELVVKYNDCKEKFTPIPQELTDSIRILDEYGFYEALEINLNETS